MMRNQHTPTIGGGELNWDQNAWFQLLIAFIAFSNDTEFDPKGLIFLFCKLEQHIFEANAVMPSIETAMAAARSLLSTLAQSNLEMSPNSREKQRGSAQPSPNGLRNKGNMFDLDEDPSEAFPNGNVFDSLPGRKRRSESQPLMSPSAAQSKGKKVKRCVSKVSDPDSDFEAVSHGYVRNLWNPPTQVQKFVDVAIPMADIDKSQYETAPSSPARKTTTSRLSSRPTDTAAFLSNGTPNDNNSPLTKLTCLSSSSSSSSSSTPTTSTLGIPTSSVASRLSALHPGSASQVSQTSQSATSTSTTPSSRLQETPSTVYRSAFAPYDYHGIAHPLVNIQCTSNNTHLVHTPKFSFPDVPLARMTPETTSAANQLETKGFEIDDAATKQSQINRDCRLAQQLQDELGVDAPEVFSSHAPQSNTSSSSNGRSSRASATKPVDGDEQSTFGSDFDLSSDAPQSSSQPPQSAGESREDRLARIKTEKKARRKAGKQKAQVAETVEDAAAETTPMPKKKPKDKKKAEKSAAKKAKKAAKQARKAAEAEQDA